MTAVGSVCAKIDRLGRSSRDVMVLVERAHDEGWRLVALDADLETPTAAGEMVAAPLAMAARFEYRRVSERQVEKFADPRRKGRSRGPVAASRDAADWVLADRENGRTRQAIADGLDAEQIPTPRGGSMWRPSSVRSAALTRQRERYVQAAQRVVNPAGFIPSPQTAEPSLQHQA